MFKRPQKVNRGIVIIETTTHNPGSSTTVTATFTGLALGDRMVVAIRAPSNIAMTNADGFTTHATGTNELFLLSKIVTDASDLSYTFTFASAASRTLIGIRFSRCRIIDDAGEGSNSGTWGANPSNIVVPAVTVTGGDTVVVFHSAYGSGSGSSSWNNGYTSIIGGTSTVVIGSKKYTTAATEGVTVSYSGTPSSGIKGARIVLRRLQ